MELTVRDRRRLAVVGLVAASPEAPAAGRSRLGGDALLEPGVPWPALEGVPLSLHAVLDIDALAGWSGTNSPSGRAC
ncbi:hypothetical protein [Kitasatospora sp. NPDC085464]|uniref:hypothetical protein n=1 Tax=Kitasatospora sp. NPDC085464 TaxID=3364063 RepID=UPI0037C63F6D